MGGKKLTGERSMLGNSTFVVLKSKSGLVLWALTQTMRLTPQLEIYYLKVTASEMKSRAASHEAAGSFQSDSDNVLPASSS